MPKADAINWGEVAMTTGIVLTVVAVALLVPSIRALVRPSPSSE